MENYSSHNSSYSTYTPKSSVSSRDEYPDAEEYYYWNYDDLFDYEDAEDLYD